MVTLSERKWSLPNGDPGGCTIIKVFRDSFSRIEDAPTVQKLTLLQQLKQIVGKGIDDKISNKMD